MTEDLQSRLSELDVQGTYVDWKQGVVNLMGAVKSFASNVVRGFLF